MNHREQRFREEFLVALATFQERAVMLDRALRNADKVGDAKWGPLVEESRRLLLGMAEGRL